MKVLIIGAGISGLTTASVLLRDGFSVSVVEKREEGVGGTWNEAFHFVKVQSSKREYRMPGRQFPDDTPFRPGRDDVLKYWQGVVADDSALSSAIRFGVEVVGLRRERDAKEQPDAWVATLKIDGACTDESYDAVVVATGIYGESRLTSTPELPGAADFPGEICHNLDLGVQWSPTKEDKTVVVVGAGPSAFAFASHCADRGAQTHVVIRDKRWFVPSRMLGGLIPHVDILYSRLNSAMLPSFRPVLRGEQILHAVFWPVVELFWRVISLVVFLSARPPTGMRPPFKDFQHALRCAIPVLPHTFMGHARSGQLQVHVPTTIASVTADGSVVLASGNTIPSVDRVILGTGYELDAFRWLSPPVRASVLRNGRQLYRHMAVPGQRGLLFAGCASSFFGCVTEYVQAHWMSALLRGEHALPPDHAMDAACRDELTWKSRHVLYEHQRPYCVGARHFQFVETLLRDMRLQPFRSGYAQAALSVWGPDHYAGLFEERARARRKAQ